MTMNCKQAQRELALWVGGDHDPLLQEMLNDHVQSCPDCRAFAREIKTGAQVLRQAAVRASNDAPAAEAGWSLWPRVQAKLAKSGPRQSPYAPATVGWFPVAGLTAACVALIAVSFSSVQSYRSDPAFEFPLGQHNFVPATSQVFFPGENLTSPGSFRMGSPLREQLPSEQDMQRMLQQFQLQHPALKGQASGRDRFSEPDHQLMLPEEEE